MAGSDCTEFRGTRMDDCGEPFGHDRPFHSDFWARPRLMEERKASCQSCRWSSSRAEKPDVPRWNCRAALRFILVCVAGDTSFLHRLRVSAIFRRAGYTRICGWQARVSGHSQTSPADQQNKKQSSESRSSTDSRARTTQGVCPTECAAPCILLE